MKYVHTTWAGRRPVEASLSPVPRPLRNWCRISSSSSNGPISKRSMYPQYNSATADTSLSSISLRQERERRGVEGTLDCRIIRAMVMSRGHVRELDVNELGHVQCAMVVPTREDGRGDHDSCSVNGLEGALEVTLPGNLLDKHWRE